MLNAYERQLILFYLSNAVVRFLHSFRAREELAEWVSENRDLLTLRDETEEPGEHQASSLYEKEWSAREWKHLRKSLEEEYAAACKGGRKDRIARLRRRLGREMDLAPEDIALIELRLHEETQPIFGSLIECFESPDQSQAAFRTYFALNPPPELGDLTILTPGDFAVVRRKAEILGHLQDAKSLAELLHAECEAKPNHSRKMGF